MKGVFVPHCDEPGRQEKVKKLLKEKDSSSIQVSNCGAIEIIDDKYKLITDKSISRNIQGYGVKSYWSNGKYYEEKIKNTSELRAISEIMHI